MSELHLTGAGARGALAGLAGASTALALVIPLRVCGSDLLHVTLVVFLHSIVAFFVFVSFWRRSFIDCSTPFN